MRRQMREAMPSVVPTATRRRANCCPHPCDAHRGSSDPPSGTHPVPHARPHELPAMPLHAPTRRRCMHVPACTSWCAIAVSQLLGKAHSAGVHTSQAGSRQQVTPGHPRARQKSDGTCCGRCGTATISATPGKVFAEPCFPHSPEPPSTPCVGHSTVSTQCACGGCARLPHQSNGPCCLARALPLCRQPLCRAPVASGCGAPIGSRAPPILGQTTHTFILQRSPPFRRSRSSTRPPSFLLSLQQPANHGCQANPPRVLAHHPHRRRRPDRRRGRSVLGERLPATRVAAAHTQQRWLPAPASTPLTAATTTTPAGVDWYVCHSMTASQISPRRRCSTAALTPAAAATNLPPPQDAGSPFPAVSSHDLGPVIGWDAWLQSG